jgi:hypothetical protein
MATVRSSSKLRSAVRERVPYNTGKVLIGSGYVPPPRRDYSKEELYWQEILLNGKPRRWYQEPLLVASLLIMVVVCVATACS